jgi:uncharacterized protein with HEPN domain
MEKDSLIYITHIIECVKKIKQYTTGIDGEIFQKNFLVQDAVIRNFEIIGEATKKLDPDFRSKYPNIEWKRIAGMRDKLIHDYFGVDILAVWGVVENIIPSLEISLNEILEAERPEN